MKKFLLGVVTLMAMAIICIISAGAETYGDYTYRVLSDGTVEITKYNGSAAVLEIPSAIGGKKVTVIGDEAFFNCTSLTSVTIPDNVTSIKSYAFWNCTSLTSVAIPDSVISMGKNVFVETPLLKNQATSVKYAGKWVVGFDDAETAEIRSGTTGISDHVFSYCKSLTTVTIPDSVTRIGKKIFQGCTSLASVNVSSKNKSYTSVDGVLFSKDKKDIIAYPCMKSGTKYVIPEGVTNIAESAFGNCSFLTSVVIPDGVVKIGGNAFTSCTSLNDVNIPDSVTSIGRNAFTDTAILTNQKADAKYIDKWLVGCNTSLESLTIRDGTVGMAVSACSGTKLVSVAFPDSLRFIDAYAFHGCSYLASVIIPDGVKSIGNDAFSICNSLTSVIIPESVTSIGDTAFSWSNKVVINCKEGSYAHSYAKNKGIAYKIMSQPLSIPVVKATAGDKQVTLSWTAVEGASYYQIIRDKDGVQSVVANISGTSATVKGLTNDFEYTYLIKAVAEDGRTSVSAAINITPKGELAKPVVKATAGDKQVALSWTAVKGASYYQIIRYNKGAYSVVATIKSTSAVVKGLTNDFEYTYLIKAVAEDGRTSLSTAINVTPKGELAKPVVKATAGDKQVALSWTAVKGAGYYQIIRDKDGVQSVVANISGTSATVKGLTNNFEYTYLIKAVAEDGRTSLSTAINVTPKGELAKPVVNATAGDKQAVLSWTAVEGASYYQIIRDKDGVQSVVANISGTTATVKGLTNNFEYTYLIKAVAADGRSSLSSAVRVTPLPALEKTTVTAVAGNKQATLSWTAVEGASYYQIIRYNKGTYSLIATVSDLSAVVKGLANNYQYTYLIKAVAADGRTSLSDSINVTPTA